MAAYECVRCGSFTQPVGNGDTNFLASQPGTRNPEHVSRNTILRYYMYRHRGTEPRLVVSVPLHLDKDTPNVWHKIEFNQRVLLIFRDTEDRRTRRNNWELRAGSFRGGQAADRDSSEGLGMTRVQGQVKLKSIMSLFHCSESLIKYIKTLE